MLSDKELHQQLEHVLSRTAFMSLGERYEGKVRDCYLRGSERILVTTDRLSCFDVVVACVPFKGQVLNDLAVHWFGMTGDVINNHIVDVPDPNVMVVKNCEILPVEVIVRAYLAGSAWRDYQAGNTISGLKLAPGMRSHQKLPEPIITPSTKAAKGSHDLPISEEEVVAGGHVDKKLWQQAREAALALFARGQAEAHRQGLILVDTKYEFGVADGKLILADEIHTLDSSRYWIAESYPRCFEDGQTPEMLDKEPTRQWLLAQGYKGDGAIPEFTPEHRVQIAKHYISSFEKISGRAFSGRVGPVAPRIEACLKKR